MTTRPTGKQILEQWTKRNESWPLNFLQLEEMIDAALAAPEPVREKSAGEKWAEEHMVFVDVEKTTTHFKINGPHETYHLHMLEDGIHGNGRVRLREFISSEIDFQRADARSKAIADCVKAATLSKPGYFLSDTTPTATKKVADQIIDAVAAVK